MISKTLLGLHMLSFLSITGSRAHLRPNSKAAASVTALLVPMPLMRHSLSEGMLIILFSLLPAFRSSSLARSITFICPVPVRSNMASSSALLREDGPFSSIFSLGLSSMLSSFSFIFFAVKVSDPVCMTADAGRIFVTFCFFFREFLFLIQESAEYEKRKPCDFLSGCPVGFEPTTFRTTI